MTTNAPDNCKCDPDSWQVVPPDICDSFAEMFDIEMSLVKDTCDNCLHDKACHTPHEVANEN